MKRIDFNLISIKLDEDKRYERRKPTQTQTHTAHEPNERMTVKHGNVKNDSAYKLEIYLECHEQ